MTALFPFLARRPSPVGFEQLLRVLGCVDPDALWPPLPAERILFGARNRLAMRPAVRAAVEPDAVAAPIEELLRILPTGGWRIADATARALAMLFDAVRPRLVLEFGSGSSTVLFAALCAIAGGGRRVISIDEKPDFALRTCRMLQDFQLADYATVVVAPVCRTRLADWSGWMYCPPAEALQAAINHDPIEMVFIDGPANWLGRRGDCRFGTLPLAASWIDREAIFAADDALRRRDLRIAHRWRTLPFVDVQGILPVGRGIAVGRVRGIRSAG